MNKTSCLQYISQYQTYINKNKQKWLYLCTHSEESDDNNIIFDTDSVPLILDTGASSGFTYDKKDFIKLQPFSGNVSGLGQLDIKGIGTVTYNIVNDNNNTVELIIAQVFYVPNLHIHLLSPQQISKQSRDPEEGLLIRDTKCVFTWDYHIKTLAYNDHSQLPIIHTSPGVKQIQVFYSKFSQLCQTRSQSNKEKNKVNINQKKRNHTEISTYDTLPSLPDSNISKNTQILLLWHEKLGHMNFNQLQTLDRQGMIPKTLLTVIYPYVCCANTENLTKD